MPISLDRQTTVRILRIIVKCVSSELVLQPSAHVGSHTQWCFKRITKARRNYAADPKQTLTSSCRILSLGTAAQVMTASCKTEQAACATVWCAVDFKKMLHET